MPPKPDSTKRDAVTVDDDRRLELQRVARLFLLAGVTLALFLLRAAVEVVPLDFLPAPVFVVWGLALLTGWAATEVFGAFVTFSARRWVWFALCLIPLTTVPAGVAYALTRRREIEREVLGAPAGRRPGRAAH